MAWLRSALRYASSIVWDLKYLLVACPAWSHCSSERFPLFGWRTLRHTYQCQKTHGRERNPVDSTEKTGQLSQPRCPRLLSARTAG